MNEGRPGFSNRPNPPGQPERGTRANPPGEAREPIPSERASQPSPANQSNEMNQLSPANQPNELNQANQLNQANELNQANQLNQPSPANQPNQSNQPSPPDRLERLERAVEMGTLCAFYGGLLTQRQQEAMRLHYQEDESLGEIARELGVTRQNVHEMITRGEQRLRQIEEAVGGAARARKTVSDLRLAKEYLQPLAAGSEEARAALEVIQRVIRRQEGEENEHGI